MDALSEIEGPPPVTKRLLGIFLRASIRCPLVRLLLVPTQGTIFGPFPWGRTAKAAKHLPKSPPSCSACPAVARTPPTRPPTSGSATCRGGGPRHPGAGSRKKSSQTLPKIGLYMKSGVFPQALLTKRPKPSSAEKTSKYFFLVLFYSFSEFFPSGGSMAARCDQKKACGQRGSGGAFGYNRGPNLESPQPEPKSFVPRWAGKQ